MDPKVQPKTLNLRELNPKLLRVKTRNQLSRLPDCFKGMSKLKEANFSSNRLTSLPSSLGSCSSLKLINCSDNQLSSLPSSLGALDALEDLQCANNSIASLPSSFEGDDPTLHCRAQSLGRES